MTLRTHITAGMAAVALAGMLGASLTPCESVTFLAGCVSPDFDLFWNERAAAGHRRGLHHIYFWAGLVLAAGLLGRFVGQSPGLDLALAFGAGGLFHLLADMITGKVYFFWGIRERMGVRLFTTASVEEKMVMAGLVSLIGYLLIFKGMLAVPFVFSAFLLWILSLHLSLNVHKMGIFIAVYILFLMLLLSPKGAALTAGVAKIFPGSP